MKPLLTSTVLSAALLSLLATSASAAETLRYDEAPAACEFYTGNGFDSDCRVFSMTRSDATANFNYEFSTVAVKFITLAEPEETTTIEGETYYVYRVVEKKVNDSLYESNGYCAVNESVNVSICQGEDLRYVYRN